MIPKSVSHDRVRAASERASKVPSSSLHGAFLRLHSSSNPSSSSFISSQRATFLFVRACRQLSFPTSNNLLFLLQISCAYERTAKAAPKSRPATRRRRRRRRHPPMLLLPSMIMPRLLMLLMMMIKRVPSSSDRTTIRTGR